MTTNNNFIHQYTPFVRAIVRQYQVPSISADDLFQEGVVGLVEAAHHFDSSRGITFQSYASWWVHKHIKEAIRCYGYIVAMPQRNAPERIYTEQLDKVVASEDGEPLTYEDVLRSTDLQPDEQLQFNEAVDAWNKLKSRQKSQKKRISVGKFMQKYVNK